MDNQTAHQKANETKKSQSARISQAMILAAGKGTRLRPLTLETPKPLVEVGGQPLIVWHINALKNAGITDITINTSWLSDKLMTALGDGEEFGVNLHWSVEDGEPLETAGGIAKAFKEGCLKQEPLLLINGDVWTEYDFSTILNHWVTPPVLAHLLMIKNPEHNPDGDFIVDDGFATLNSEAGKKQTFSGISIISPKLVEGIKAGEVAALGPLLKESMAVKKVTAEIIDCKWVDVGTPERLDLVNQYVTKQGGHLDHTGKPTL